MAPKHTTGGPRAHYPGINKVAPAHAIGGSHRSEYSSTRPLPMFDSLTAECGAAYWLSRSFRNLSSCQ